MSELPNSSGGVLPQQQQQQEQLHLQPLPQPPPAHLASSSPVTLAGGR